MIYKLLKTNEDGIKIYARIDDDGLCRVTCTEQNPEYLAWVAEGGVTLSADEPASQPADE
jgi:hypothetical protein